MFRFFATLLVTGVAVVAASAWWSGREAPSQWPTLSEQPPVEPATAPPTAPEAPVAIPEEPVTETTAKPVVPAPAPLPAIAAAPAPELRVETQRVPAIPAPPLTDPAEYTRVVAPVPALPEPIPAPFSAPASREEVEETRIPEPAEFEDEILGLENEILELARDEESYGEENVIYVEGDDRYGGSLDELFAREAGEPFVGEDETFAGEERAVAMSAHDASAARIRRLLDVYESLGSRR